MYLHVWAIRVFKYNLLQVLTAKDRAGLLNDAFALSFAGQLDTTVALNLSKYLVHERSFAPWKVAISWLYKMDGLLRLTPNYGQFQVSSYHCRFVVQSLVTSEPQCMNVCFIPLK